MLLDWITLGVIVAILVITLIYDAKTSTSSGGIVMSYGIMGIAFISHYSRLSTKISLVAFILLFTLIAKYLADSLKYKDFFVTHFE